LAESTIYIYIYIHIYICMCVYIIYIYFEYEDAPEPVLHMRSATVKHRALVVNSTALENDPKYVSNIEYCFNNTDKYYLHFFTIKIKA